MNKDFVLSGNRIVTPNSVIPGNLVVKSGKIVGIESKPTPGLEQIDLGDSWILPGFIDLHIHGAGGWDVSTDSDSSLKMAKFLAYNGITAFYPTPATVALDQFLAILRAVNTAKKEQEEVKLQEKESGAEMLGLHLEGPFLNKEKKGAMPEKFLRQPSI